MTKAARDSQEVDMMWCFICWGSGGYGVERRASVRDLEGRVVSCWTGIDAIVGDRLLFIFKIFCILICFLESS